MNPAALAAILRQTTGGRCGSTPNNPGPLRPGSRLLTCSPPAHRYRGSQVNISIPSRRWFHFCPKATIRESQLKPNPSGAAAAGLAPLCPQVMPSSILNPPPTPDGIEVVPLTVFVYNIWMKTA